MAYTVRPVKSRKELRQFIRLPYFLYRRDPIWIPPLRSEEKKKFSIESNPSLAHCRIQNFLLYKDGKTVGRICAFVHHRATAHWNASVGTFCCYECIDDEEAARLLLETTAQWLRDRGAKIMRGPWDFDTKEWGLVIKGYERPPMIMAPHNPPYYHRHMAGSGLSKVKDLLAYELDCSQAYVIPDRFLKLTESISQKYGVKIRGLDMKHLERDIKIILDVGNASTSPNWGYVPVTDAEAHAIARAMKPIVDPDIVMIAEVGARPIGMIIVFPDVNTILKDLNGRLFPKGLLRFIFGRNNIRQYRIWALGVIPDYQRRAIDTLFYRRLYEVVIPKNPVRLEANYVLEDNMAMSNPILKLGFSESRRYRVYEKEL